MSERLRSSKCESAPIDVGTTWKTFSLRSSLVSATRAPSCGKRSIRLQERSRRSKFVSASIASGPSTSSPQNAFIARSSFTSIPPMALNASGTVDSRFEERSSSTRSGNRPPKIGTASSTSAAQLRFSVVSARSSWSHSGSSNPSAAIPTASPPPSVRHRSFTSSRIDSGSAIPTGLSLRSTSTSALRAPSECGSALIALPDTSSSVSAVTPPIDSGSATKTFTDTFKCSRRRSSPIDIGSAASELPEQSKCSRHVSAPIDSGNAVSSFARHVNTTIALSEPISSGSATRSLPSTWRNRKFSNCNTPRGNSGPKRAQLRWTDSTRSTVKMSATFAKIFSHSSQRSVGSLRESATAMASREG